MSKLDTYHEILKIDYYHNFVYQAFEIRILSHIYEDKQRSLSHLITTSPSKNNGLIAHTSLFNLSL